MSRPLSLSAVLFYAGQRQAVSIARIREGMDLAATLSDPLRGDPLSPEVQRVAEVATLLRATAAEPEPDTDCGLPETVPVLAPGELTHEQVRDRAGMVGTVLVLAGVFGAALGVVWAWVGGAL